MSVDLRRKDGKEFSFSTIGWALYLNIAAVGYNWPKAGTQQPEKWSVNDGPWTGAYDWNAGQTVTEADALALASALERYLTDPAKEQVLRSIASDIGNIIGIELDVSNDDRDHIASFVQFASQGEFQIW